MERNIKETEVFEIIKDVVYDLHPVKQPRIDFWEYVGSGIKKPEMDILFYFYRDFDDSIKTQITIMDRFGISKNYTQKDYLIDSSISEETIGKLITFILSEFPYMLSLHQQAGGFEINFSLGAEHEEEQGISCSKINIEFDTHPKLYESFRKLFRDYLEYIVNTFYGAVSNTADFKEAYKKYSDKIKMEILDSLSYEELKKLINLIDEKRLRMLLSDIDNDYFFELCNLFQKNNETTKKKILELKSSAIDDVIDSK